MPIDPTVHMDERLEALGGNVNYCPFGCLQEDLEEHGYCKHLVGFAQGHDAKIGSKVERVHYRTDPDTGERTGYCSVIGKRGTLDEVKKGDVLINPEELVKYNGLQVLAKKWVNARVYRRENEPVEAPNKKLAKATA